MRDVKTEDQMSIEDFRDANVAAHIMRKRRLEAILIDGQDPEKTDEVAPVAQEQGEDLDEEGIVMDPDSYESSDGRKAAEPSKSKSTASLLSGVAMSQEGVLEIRMSDINVKVPVYRGSITDTGAAFFISESQSLSLRIGLELTIEYKGETIPVMYVGGSFPFPDEKLVLLSFMKSQLE